jgi:hypothetical protein
MAASGTIEANGSEYGIGKIKGADLFTFSTCKMYSSKINMVMAVS